jgi:hypothetical protein
MISLGGDDGSDAGFVEQCRCERAYVAEQFAFELVGFEGGGPDSTCEAAQDEPCGELIGARVRAAETAAAVEQLAGWQCTELLAEFVGRRHDHGAQLCQGLAADIDGAPPRDQQEPQCFPPFAGPRERECVGRECRPRRASGVEGVVLAAQPPVCPGRAADLEHRLAVLGEITGETGAVASGALDRPSTPAKRALLGEAKQLPVAARVRARGLAGNDSARGRRHDNDDVLVAVRVDTDHVVQFVCKHPTRSSDLVRRVRWCRSDARETAAAGR